MYHVRTNRVCTGYTCNMHVIIWPSPVHMNVMSIKPAISQSIRFLTLPGTIGTWRQHQRNLD